MGIHAVRGFFVFYFGILSLPPHNHPPSRLGMRMQLRPFSRTFPFIYAFDHGGQPCPRVSSSTSSQPLLSLSLISLDFLDSLRWVWCCSLAGTGSPTLQGVNLTVLMHGFSNRCVLRLDKNEPSLSQTAKRNHDRDLRLFIPAL